MKYYKSIRNGRIFSEKELERILANMGLNIEDVSEVYVLIDDTTKFLWSAGLSAEGNLTTRVSLSIKEKAIVDDFIRQAAKQIEMIERR